MRLDLRTRLFAELMARTGRSVADMSEEEITRSRTPPRRAWFTEPVIGRLAPGSAYDDVWIPGAAGEVRARVYRPARPAPERPVVVHFHGGGSVYGHHYADWLCTWVAVRVDAVVVSVDYRLAPEHRCPAGRDDAYCATAWLAEHAETLAGRGDRLAVMGDSAGGNLAAVVSLMARDRGGPRLHGQVLIYPVTDVTFSSPSVDRLAGAAVLTKRDMEVYVRHYLGQDDDPRDPYVSPLLAADHRGLPRALVQTAEQDPLVDDGERYAKTLAAAGVPVRHTRYVGAPHGFMGFPGVCRFPAHQALEEICAELAAVLR